MKIAFTGDVYLADAMDSPKVDHDLCTRLSSCDHIVANLEGPITSIHAPIIKTGPVMKQTKAVLKLFDTLNIDIVGLANNHIADHGSKGISETIQTLSKHNLSYAGAGLSIKQIYNPIQIAENDINISLIFAAENGFGCLTDFSDNEIGYAWIFHKEFNKILKQAISESNFVIVYIHAGVEHIDRPLPQWRKVFHSLIDSGVHAVIAHHPHLTQGIEIYKNAPIFYSIGNFYFNEPMAMQHWYHSQVPMLILEKNKSVRYELLHSHFGLESGGHITMVNSSWGNERTERLSCELVSHVYDHLIANDLKYLWQTRYGNSFDLSINAFKSARSFLSTIKRVVLEIGGQGQWKRNPERLEALVEIESHRWAIAEFMRNIKHDEG